MVFAIFHAPNENGRFFEFAVGWQNDKDFFLSLS